MSNDDSIIIRRAYAEASLAAKEKGLSGLRARNAVLATAAAVGTRILGRTITSADVESLMQQAD
jgi:hypothetical protein